MGKLESEDFFFVRSKNGDVVISRVDHIKKRIFVDLKNHVNIEVDVIVSTDGQEYDEMNDGPILKVKEFRDVISDEKILLFMKEQKITDTKNQQIKTPEEIEQEEQNKLIQKLLNLNKSN